jgi:hypothetical protein
MYLTNKYTTWYYSIITRANQRVNQEGYVEKHHIIKDGTVVIVN